MSRCDLALAKPWQAALTGSIVPHTYACEDIDIHTQHLID